MTRRRYNTPSTRDPLGFTHCERLYADMLVAGYSARDMARLHHASTTCVRTHLYRVYKKLGVNCAAHAVDALIGRRVQDLSEPFAAEPYEGGNMPDVQTMAVMGWTPKTEQPPSEPFADEADPRELPYAGYETGVAPE